MLTHARSPQRKSVEGRMIPRSYDECEDFDKQLISMRDAGTGWGEIRKAWTDATGEKTGKSTLPNRYM